LRLLRRDSWTSRSGRVLAAEEKTVLEGREVGLVVVVEGGLGREGWR
jgi:hypothetical protein